MQKGDHKWYAKEKELVKHFDRLARVVADKAGHANKDIPWTVVT